MVRCFSTSRNLMSMQLIRARFRQSRALGRISARTNVTKPISRLMKALSAISMKGISNKCLWVTMNWKSSIPLAKKKRLSISQKLRLVMFVTSFLQIWSPKCKKNYRCSELRMKRHPSRSVWCSCNRITSPSRRIWEISSTLSSIT